MQLYNFYLRQKVTQGEVDAAFAGAEDAIDRVYTDLGLVGIIYQATVTEHSPTPDLTVDISAGIVIDQAGQRIYWNSIQNVDMSIDENGTSTAVVGTGNEKWLSLFAKFERALSDPRVDGDQETVYFNVAESFSFKVVQGPEESAPATTKPSLRSDQILLCDVKIDKDTVAITNAMINTDRREWAIQASSTFLAIERGQLEDALQDILDALEDHKDSATATSEHNAIAIKYAGSPSWKTGNPMDALNVEAALDEIVSDLADDAGTEDGAARIGVDAQSSTTTPVLSTTQGSIKSQILELLEHVAGANKYTQVAEWHDTTKLDSAETNLAVDEAVDDLASTAGSDKIGSTEINRDILNLEEGSVYDQLLELITHIDSEKQIFGRLKAENWEPWIDLFSAAVEGHGVAFGTKDLIHMFVFVGSSGSAGEAFYSDSGIGSKQTITLAGSPTELNDVEYDSYDHQFVMVGKQATDAYLATSSDGTSWSEKTLSLGSNSVLRGVTHGDDAGSHAIIAVGYDGTGTDGIVLRSTDGSTWAEETGMTSDDWYGVASDGIKAFTVVGVYSSAAVSYHSNDGGQTWVAGTGLPGTTSQLNDVCYEAASDRYYACGVDDGNGMVYKSAEGGGGTPWTDISPVGMSSAFTSINTDGEGTIIVTGMDAGVPRFYITTDGGTSWKWFTVSLGSETIDVGERRTLYHEGGRYFHFDNGDRDVWYSLKSGGEGDTT